MPYLTSFVPRLGPAGFFGTVVFLAFGMAAAAQEPSAIVRVDEDWELVVDVPDFLLGAPQVVCVISPTGNIDSLYAAMEINQETLPETNEGGLQLQVWDGEVPLRDTRYPQNAVLSTTGEEIRWTQSMVLEGSTLTFEILNGTSTTWGSFGGQGYLKANMATELNNLDGYHPDVSVAHSGVSFGANRVRRLVLREVRLHTASGEVLVSSTPRVVVYTPSQPQE